MFSFSSSSQTNLGLPLPSSRRIRSSVCRICSMGKAVVLKLLEIVVFLCDKHHLVLVEGFKAEPVIFADHANQTQVKAAFQNFVQNALAVTLMDIEIGFRTQLFVGRKKLRQQ